MPLLDALRLGGPGCISATANLNARAISNVIDLYDRGDVDEATRRHEQVRRFRTIIDDYAPIPAQKRLLAIASGDARWANVRAPLMAMDETQGRELAGVLRSEFDDYANS